MPYLLDTNVVIRHLNGDPDTRVLVRKLTSDGIAVNTVMQSARDRPYILDQGKNRNPPHFP